MGTPSLIGTPLTNIGKLTIEYKCYCVFTINGRKCVMVSSLTTPQDLNLSVAETVDLLTKELGGESSRWATWLANDRKPGRVNRRLSPEPGPGRPRYDAAMVKAFVADSKSNHQPPQAEKPPAASRPKKFAPSILALTQEEGNVPPAVLLVLPQPLQVFVLSAEEARNVARRLANVADEIDPGVSS